MRRIILLMSAVFSLSVLVFTGCTKEAGSRENKKENIMNSQLGDAGSLNENLSTLTGASEGRELSAAVNSEDEAKEIATQYGIEFVDFSYGVAVFHTEEDPVSVINRGKKNGWPLLSINGQSYAFGGADQLDELDKGTR